MKTYVYEPCGFYANMYNMKPVVGPMRTCMKRTWMNPVASMRTCTVWNQRSVYEDMYEHSREFYEDMSPVLLCRDEFEPSERLSADMSPGQLCGNIGEKTSRQRYADMFPGRLCRNKYGSSWRLYAVTSLGYSSGTYAKSVNPSTWTCQGAARAWGHTWTRGKVLRGRVHKQPVMWQNVLRILPFRAT
jgi:hypothetical protein